MLKILRQKKLIKIIFWTMFIMALPAFFFWGMGSVKGPKEAGSAPVGTIGDNEISLDELLKSMGGVRTQMILNYFGQSQVLDNFLSNKPLQAMLGWKRLVLLKDAMAYEITVPDKEVVSYIRSHPLFSRGGKFNAGLYTDRLKYSIGLTPRDFEETVRGNITVQKLKEMLSQDVKISDEELMLEYRRANEKIQLSYILIPSRDFTDKVKIDDQTVRDYYENHKTEFMVPSEKDAETSNILSFDDVKKVIRVFIAEGEARSLSRKYAEDIYKKISSAVDNDGATFEAAAGKLGLKTRESPLFARSDKVEGLKDADFLMDVALSLKKPGQVSNPVETRDGIIIFKVSKNEGVDEEKFKKEKGNYSETILETARMERLEARFRELSPKAHLNIEIKDIEKYVK
jgi:hypothetical protein